MNDTDGREDREDTMRAIYARVAMTGGDYRRWMASKIKRADDFDDWGPLAGTPSSQSGAMTVEQFANTLAARSPLFCCEYDDLLGAAVVADPYMYRTTGEAARIIAALRGAADFTDDGGYIIAWPAESGGDPDALLRITRGASQFIDPSSDEPEVLYFVNEAEEMIDALLDDDE